VAGPIPRNEARAGLDRGPAVGRRSQHPVPRGPRMSTPLGRIGSPPGRACSAGADGRSASPEGSPGWACAAGRASSPATDQAASCPLTLGAAPSEADRDLPPPAAPALARGVPCRNDAVTESRGLRDPPNRTGAAAPRRACGGRPLPSWAVPAGHGDLEHCSSCRASPARPAGTAAPRPPRAHHGTNTGHISDEKGKTYSIHASNRWLDIAG
jgi:hypothetical protein